VVAFTDSASGWSGNIARRQAITNPENTIFAVKRLIGRASTIPSAEGDEDLPVQDREGRQRRCLGRESVASRYSPQRESRRSSSEDEADREDYLGEKVTEAVITVPAYFNEASARHQGRRRIAGLNVPAHHQRADRGALAYGLDKKKDEKIAVFDLGGGTFDISILELGDGVFEVKAPTGHFLGGEDFDQASSTTWPTSSRRTRASTCAGSHGDCSG
jgi:molecular chaperone DnaK